MPRILQPDLATLRRSFTSFNTFHGQIQHRYLDMRNLHEQVQQFYTEMSAEVERVGSLPSVRGGHDIIRAIKSLEADVDDRLEAINNRLDEMHELLNAISAPLNDVQEQVKYLADRDRAEIHNAAAAEYNRSFVNIRCEAFVLCIFLTLTQSFPVFLQTVMRWNL